MSGGRVCEDSGVARLKFIDVWPQTSFFDRPWGSAPVDAVARTARRVCEAHSVGLRTLGLTAPRASYRLLAQSAGDVDSLRVELIDDLDDHNIGILHVPADAHRWLPQPRAAAVLDAIHHTTMLMGERLGWDVDGLRQVRDQVAASGARFLWEGPWKTSPGRASRARLRALWADDGYGRISVQVAGPAGSLFSPPIDSFSTPEGLQRTAATLAWQPEGAMWMLPSILPFGIPDRPGATIRPDQLLDHDPLTDQPGPRGDFLAPTTVTAAWQDASPYRLDQVFVSTGSDAWGTPPQVEQSIDQVNADLSAILREWLEAAGVRELEWFYDYHESAKTQLRIYDKRPLISIFQQRAKADLTDPTTCASIVLDDLQRALDRLATKLGNEPAPQLHG